jgi:hypothetical protein
MPIYGFTLISASGGSQEVAVREAASDDDACELASELLLESDFAIVEVLHGRRVIYRVSKIDPEPSERKPAAPSVRSRAERLADDDSTAPDLLSKRG